MYSTEVRMADPAQQIAIGKVIDDCMRYWLETNVSKSTAQDMKTELHAHLVEAVSDGRTLSDVVGPDIPRFAEDWASEARPPSERTLPSWDDVATGRSAADRRSNFITFGLFGISIAAIVASIIATNGRGNDVDMELWRWIWTGAAFLLAIGEIFTAGFFLLPFAIGAGVAAVFSWIGLNILVQWVGFLGVSVASMVYLQRFIRRQDELPVARVGANRYVGAQALVLEGIDPVRGTGRVRVDTEEWRATTDGHQIRKNATVRVTDVRGARLVVTEIE